MKYSFVIPTYNNRTLLKNTMEALNYLELLPGDDFEVIIADDGSTDGTGEYIEKAHCNYPMQYFFLERNSGFGSSRARNAGWKKAAGEFIIFIDGDILVKGSYLRDLSRCFALNKDILVTGLRLMLDEPVRWEEIGTQRVFERYHFDKERYQLLDDRYLLYALNSFNANALVPPWTQFYGCNLALPKKWLERVGGFDENFKEWGLEDLEFSYSLYKNGIRLVCDSRLEVLHQYHGPRNDLVIEAAKMPGYEKNLEYFLEKHPKALGPGMTKKIAFKYLKGDLGLFNRGRLNLHPECQKIQIELHEGGKVEEIKEQIKVSLEAIRSNEVEITVFDYQENSDLDIWVQLLDTPHNAVRYFPMSKQIDTQALREYINSVKEPPKNTK